MEQQERALSAYVESVQGDERNLAVVVVGSVARGNERPDSDVDVYLVVDDASFAEAMPANRLAWIERRDADYPGAYIDIKLASPRYLAAAIERGDDPTRASFVGARLGVRSDRTRARAGGRGRAARRRRGPTASARTWRRRACTAGTSCGRPPSATTVPAAPRCAAPRVRGRPGGVRREPHVPAGTEVRGGDPRGGPHAAGVPRRVGGGRRRPRRPQRRGAPRASGRVARRSPSRPTDTLSTFIRDNELAWLRGSVPAEYF